MRPLSVRWALFLAGGDATLVRSVQRFHAAYRRALKRREAEPWTDLGGEG